MISPNLTGLTGGIGSGKSSVASFFCRHFNVTWLSADAAVHQLLEPGEACWRIIHDVDAKFINPDQSINKPLFRASLFADTSLRNTINDRMHPAVRDFLMQKVRSECAGGQSDFLLEVPLLFEAGWQEMFSGIIVVGADEYKCLARIVDRDGVSLDQAKQSIVAQMPLVEKIARADYVIDNSGTWDETAVGLMNLGEKLWGKVDI